MRASIPWKWVALFAAVKVTATMAFSDRYGWHGDELYFLASSRHFAFGYVDYPPLVPLLAAADQAVAPGSRIALRLLPALAGAGIVILTGLIARELGATTRAQAWAAFGALLSPVFLGANILFHTTTFDQLVWVVALVVFSRSLSSGEQRLWPVSDCQSALDWRRSSQLPPFRWRCSWASSSPIAGRCSARSGPTDRTGL